MNTNTCYRQSTEYKKRIREKFNYTCQLCGVPQVECVFPLVPHHIDYDKANCLPSNLITLCNSCNSKVNFNRDEWQVYFSDKLVKELC